LAGVGDGGVEPSPSFSRRRFLTEKAIESKK
jgi:hypothetical protein